MECNFLHVTRYNIYYVNQLVKLLVSFTKVIKFIVLSFISLDLHESNLGYLLLSLRTINFYFLILILS